MRPTRYLLPLLFVLGMTSVASAASAGKTVTIVNTTQYTLNDLYASSSDDTSSWDTTNNLLAATLAPGQQVTVPIADGLDQCSYDLMGVLYGAAQASYRYSVNACSGDTWTITQGS
jgi:hypothetical protein